jgi:hypothetical protein
MNITGQQDYVPEVERYIQAIMERVMSIYNKLPFKFIPPVMLAELVSYCTFWLNAFLKQDGI